MLPKDQLLELFAEKDLDLGKRTIFMSESEVTACVGDLAWAICGGKKRQLYDGSWT